MDVADLTSLLTDHEWRVAAAVGRGSANKAVARELSLSVKTIEFHLSNIFRKLQISSRTELANAVGRRSERLDERSGRVGNLTRERTRLFGRAVLEAEVEREVRAGPLVTLTGVGGVGKTSLARQVAHHLADEFRDGAWIIELAALRAGADVAAATAIALGLHERWSAPTPQDIATALARQHRLVLLDNCEHVLDEAARLTSAIVDGCPDVTVLATSRERLDVRGERVLLVPPLGVDAVDADERDDDPDGRPARGAVTVAISTERRSPAVRLFVDRAQSAFREFVPTEREWPVLDSLCRRLDGLPLAIELAAARVAGLSVDEIHRRVDDRFALLTRRETTGTHHSLFRAIEWSYELLSDEEREVFESLSVFAGDFDARGADAVVTAGDLARPVDVAAQLASLVDKSMVVVAQRDGARRYRLLDTLRDFARRRLDERGNEPAVARRHLDHYGALAHELDLGLRGPDELAAHVTVVADWHNFRTAIAIACDADDATAAIALLDDLFWWALTRLRGEIGEWSERVRLLPSARDHPQRSVATTISSSCAEQRGELVLAHALLATAREEEQRLGPMGKPWIPVTAAGLEAEAKVMWAANQDTQAWAVEHDSLFFLTCGRLQEAAYLGAVITYVDLSPEKAADLVERIRTGIELADRLDNPNAQAFAAMTLGIALQVSDPAQAIELLEGSLAMSEPLDLGLLAFQARRALATARTVSGRADEALEVIATSLRTHLRTGAHTAFTTDLSVCVPALLDVGERETAVLIIEVLRRLTLGAGWEEPLAIRGLVVEEIIPEASLAEVVRRAEHLELIDVVTDFLALVEARSDPADS